MKRTFFWFFCIATLPYFSTYATEDWASKKTPHLCKHFRKQPSFIKETPAWMMGQIQSDLAPFAKSGVKAKDLDQLMQAAEKNGNPSCLVRFKIEKQKVSSYHPPTDNTNTLSRTSSLTEAFNQLAQMAQLPNVDFIVTMHDSLDGVHLPAPIFAFANDPMKSPTIVLIPDCEALTGNKNLLEAVHKGNARYPWQTKLDQAMWRGAMTGAIFSSENFLKFPRSQAITYSLQFPDKVNARYTTLAQCIDCEAIQSQYSQYFDTHLSIEPQIRYKYQLLIDGNSAAYSRAYWQLFSNCVILKQNSPAIQWYSRALQPWVHYIPVQSDLSDLIDAIQWTKDHDTLAQQISKEAQRFAQNNLRHHHVLQYLYLLLTEYAELQK